MRIRRATSEDAERISYLIHRNTDEVIENNYSIAQKKAWKAANTPAAIRKQLLTRTIFCAFQHGRLVGTIALQGSEIVGLYVSYSKRGQGIGKKLLQNIEKYARDTGLKRLELTSTPSARQFYLSNGYEAVGEVIVPINGVNFYETKMAKSL